MEGHRVQHLRSLGAPDNNWKGSEVLRELSGWPFKEYVHKVIRVGFIVEPAGHSFEELILNYIRYSSFEEKLPEFDDFSDLPEPPTDEEINRDKERQKNPPKQKKKKVSVFEEHMITEDHYEILGLAELRYSATEKDIRDACTYQKKNQILFSISLKFSGIN